MEITKIIIRTIEYLAFIPLGFATLYIFVFGTAGLFGYRQKIIQASIRRKIAVLIPGYKEDSVIISTARESLGQTYPRDSYDVYIIADSFSPDTLRELRGLDVTVMEVRFDKSTKARALNEAMRRIDREYQVAVILDADNIMAPDFLDLVNQSFERGRTFIQGHRVAKNTNTRFAILDAISEEINNHIFRKGHCVLGFSSALIGSGMAFPYDYYKMIMVEVTAHGEDKELEIKLLANRIKIEYLHGAMVMDEKVQKAEVFAGQRKRWLSAQFQIFRQYFGTGLVQLFTKGNVDLFDKVVQMILPPRVLHLGISTLLLLVFSLRLFMPAFDGQLSIPLFAWFILWALTAGTLLISVPRRYFNRHTLLALLTLPKAFVIMLLSLFRLRGANKSFIHTTHGTSK